MWTVFWKTHYRWISRLISFDTTALFGLCNFDKVIPHEQTIKFLPVSRASPTTCFISEASFSYFSPRFERINQLVERETFIDNGGLRVPSWKIVMWWVVVQEVEMARNWFRSIFVIFFPITKMLAEAVYWFSICSSNVNEKKINLSCFVNPNKTHRSRDSSWNLKNLNGATRLWSHQQYHKSDIKET